MKIDTILDRTVTIRASVHEVEFTLALTIGLVVMVILLFLRNFWATFIPALTVPLALLGSCAAMYHAQFQSRQHLADGAHDRGRLRGRRRHRGGGEHLPPYRARHAAVRGGAQGLARDRFHGALDQLLADRGIHSAAAHGRDHRPAVPRICPDGDGLDRGLGAGLADACPDALLALHAAGLRRSRPPVQDRRSGFRRPGRRLSAHARHRAASPGDHARACSSPPWR